MMALKTGSLAPGTLAPGTLAPREKLLQSGVTSLTDTELLAILLRTGAGSTSVLHLASDLLAHFGGLRGLLRADTAELE